jgi:hypothetical protein
LVATYVTVDGTYKELKLLQPAKASLEIPSTPSSIMTDSRELHPEKTSGLIVVIPDGIVIEVKPVPLKAPLPILVTEFGIVIEVNPRHPAKA